MSNEQPKSEENAGSKALPSSSGSQYAGKVVIQHDEVMEALDELSWVAEAFRKRKGEGKSVNSLRAALIMCAQDVAGRVELELATAITTPSANDNVKS